MGLSKKGINASTATREGTLENRKGDLTPSELGYVVLIQAILFLVSLVLMLR
jgi:hypothetical protein